MSDRSKLYKVLSEPIRLRLLALCAAEELMVGELAELVDESQPVVSRHLKQLRDAGLIASRKQGRSVLAKVEPLQREDLVVADAIAAGTALCLQEGRLARLEQVLAQREHASLAHFADAAEDAEDWPAELPTYLAALAPLIPARALAIDVGTGDGAMLDLLAPIFERVIAFDRSATRVDQARARVARRGYRNVEFFVAELEEFSQASPRAEAVFAARVLHHAAQPERTMRQLKQLLAPGGALVVVDYAPHHDERLREDHADIWLGFSAGSLEQMAQEAGLREVRVTRVSASATGVAQGGEGPHDAHLDWHILAGRTPCPTPTHTKTSIDPRRG